MVELSVKLLIHYSWRGKRWMLRILNYIIKYDMGLLNKNGSN